MTDDMNRPAGVALESLERVVQSVGAVLADSRVQRLLAVGVFIASLLYLLRSLEPTRVPEAPPVLAFQGPLTVPWSGSWSAVLVFEDSDLWAEPPARAAGSEPLLDPGLPPQLEPEPEYGEFGYLEVEVQDGDSLWRLARRHLGQGHLWPRIAAANPDVDPDRLRVGTRLRVPVGTPPGQGAGRAARPARCVVGNALPTYTGDRAGPPARLSPGTVYLRATVFIGAVGASAAHRGKGST